MPQKVHVVLYRALEVLQRFLCVKKRWHWSPEAETPSSAAVKWVGDAVRFKKGASKVDADYALAMIAGIGGWSQSEWRNLRRLEG
jgi:hypothetical protein